MPTGEASHPFWRPGACVTQRAIPVKRKLRLQPTSAVSHGDAKKVTTFSEYVPSSVKGRDCPFSPRSFSILFSDPSPELWLQEKEPGPEVGAEKGSD